MKRWSRFLLLIVCLWPCLGVADLAQENPTAGMKRWGSGEFRRYGFLIYEARLWAGGADPTQPPLAIQLTYKRDISADDIVEASVTEIRRLAVAAETQLSPWRAQMKNLFPDVRSDDRILGVYDEAGAHFFHNGKFIGSIGNPEFARAFFDIWLHAGTSAPDLRDALLAAAPS